MSLDPDALTEALGRFDGDRRQRRAVARAARDLADSGRYHADTGVELASEFVVSELADAPDGGPADRWNWWIGSLELAYGGYAEFRIHRWRSNSRND